MANKQRKIILISENEELYKSFNRALLPNVITKEADIKNIKGHITNNKDIILFICNDRNEIYKLLWDDVRIDLRCKNPVIFLGFHKNKSTEDIRDLVFEKKETKESHRYLQIPFFIDDLYESISNAKPFTGKLSMLIEKYCDWKGIVYQILTHELPNKLRAENKGDAVALYERMIEILTSLRQASDINDIIGLFEIAKKDLIKSDLSAMYENFIDKAKKLREALNERVSNVYR